MRLDHVVSVKFLDAEPHLWGMSAPAMGLTVADGFGSPAFLTFLRSCHPEVLRVGPALPRRQRAGRETFPRGFPHVVAVLTDSASLAGALAEEATAGVGPGHFAVWRYPHLFPTRCEDRTTPAPPLGWASSRNRVAHPAVSGATNAVWDIVAWWPHDGAGAAGLGTPTVPPAPWRPLGAVLTDKHDGTRVALPHAVPEHRPRVRWMLDGALSDAGLFPHDRPAAEVVTRRRGLKDAAVRRPLHREELWALWDVPLSVQEAWRDSPSPGAGWGPGPTTVLAKILSTGGFAHLQELQRGGVLVKTRGGSVGGRAGQGTSGGGQTPEDHPGGLTPGSS